MAMTIGTRGDQPYADINMTPLIDVMLVLLIVFIITIPNRTHSITVDNPSAQTPVTKPRVIELSIDFDGTISWNGDQVSPAKLLENIRRESAESHQPEIQIIADRFAKYEIVAQTLAELQREGLKKIGFVNNADF